MWLDDRRPAPPGGAETPERVIALLRSGAVTRVSLDHDLGLRPGRNGHAVLAWLERELDSGRWGGPLPEISVHSANPSGRRRMVRTLERIRGRTAGRR